MKENLRAVGAAHGARALLARRLGIYASATGKLDRFGRVDRPVFLGKLPFSVNAGRGDAASASTELTIPPVSLLKQEHLASNRALFDL